MRWIVFMGFMQMLGLLKIKFKELFADLLR